VLPRLFDRCADHVSVSPVATNAVRGAHVLPPGVDTTLFTPPAHGSERVRRVLYVGRVERTSRWKGLQVLIESLPRLREEAPGARLEVVGTGDDVPHLQRLARRHGVGDLVEWRGAVAHRDLPEHYRRAAVTVLPSLTESESFGIALVEAMSSGCPVVGSDVGGIPFVVRDGVDGLLVPPGDSTALATALASVLLDADRAADLGAAGREAAVTRWDWSCREQRLVAVINAVRRPQEVAA
jgi:glycosyltransferase involved in cell wall biosynthesis